MKRGPWRRCAGMFALLVAAVVVTAAAAARAEAVDESAAPVKAGLAVDLRPALTAARTAVREGDFERADRLYRMMTEALPQVAELRLEHAAAATRSGRSARAREILVPLDVDALPPGQRDTFRRLAWGAQAFDFTVAPRLTLDSNLNSGPSEDTIRIGGVTFSLSEETMPQSSPGVGATVGAQALWMLGSDVAFGVTGVGDVDVYEESSHDDVRLTVTAGPRMLVGPALVRVNALAGVVSPEVV